jgi:hypothetical protein
LFVAALILGIAAWQTVDLYGPAIGIRKHRRSPDS